MLISGRISRAFFQMVLIIALCFIPACQSSDSHKTLVPSPTVFTSNTPAPTVIYAPSHTPTPVATTTPMPSSSPLPTPFSVFAPTVNMSFEELVGDNGYYEYPKGFPKSDTYHVIVDIYHQVVMVYKKDSEGKYTVPVRYMLCSTGLNGKTPIGTFKMERYHVRYGFFHVQKLYGQYWSEIYNRIYFHSILYSKKDASTYLKDTYDKLGQPDSNGCVHLTVPDACWIYYNLAPGTEVEIQKGSVDDKETALIRLHLVLAPAPEAPVKLEKSKIPNTDNWSITNVPDVVPFKQGKQT